MIRFLCSVWIRLFRALECLSVADPLTKLMESSKLKETLETNRLDVEQPTSSVIKQRAEDPQRRKAASLVGFEFVVFS